MYIQCVWAWLQYSDLIHVQVNFKLSLFYLGINFESLSGFVVTCHHNAFVVTQPHCEPNHFVNCNHSLQGKLLLRKYLH